MSGFVFNLSFTGVNVRAINDDFFVVDADDAELVPSGLGDNGSVGVCFALAGAEDSEEEGEVFFVGVNILLSNANGDEDVASLITRSVFPADAVVKFAAEGGVAFVFAFVAVTSLLFARADEGERLKKRSSSPDLSAHGSPGLYAAFHT